MTMMRGAFKYVALGLFAYFIIIAAQHFAIQSKTPSRDVYYDAPNENAMSHAHDAPPQDGPSQLRRFSLGRDGRDPHEDRLASDSSRTNSGAKKDPMPSLLSMGTSLRDQQTVTNAFKGRAVLKEEITMLSHGTVSKLSRMLTQLQLWTGPASIAVYLQSQEETLKFHDFVSRNEHELQNAAFHLYYEEAVSPEGEARFYPYNILRNLALNQLESDYFFAVDVDFVTPLEGGYEKLKLLVQQDPEVQARLHSKTFLVLPAFEDKQGVSEENAVSELPRTKDELVRRLQPNGGTMIGFRMDDFPKGHAPTKYDRWSKYTHPLYDIEYGFKFEPCVIGYNRGLPQYWPDFRYSFHFNKYSWFLEAHYSGFKYAVLCDQYVIHLEHSVESKKGGNVEESVNQWRKFKQYLMDRYGAPREELRDVYGFQGDEPFKGPISKKSALSIYSISTERKNDSDDKKGARKMPVRTMLPPQSDHAHFNTVDIKFNPRVPKEEYFAVVPPEGGGEASFLQLDQDLGVAIGGFENDYSTVTRYVQLLNITSQTWEKVVKLPEDIAETHQGVDFDANNRWLYLISGQVGGGCLPAVPTAMRMHVDSHEVQKLQPLPQPRYGTSVVVVPTNDQTYLHVFGGVSQDRRSVSLDHWRLDVSSSDLVDIGESVWESQERAPDAGLHSTAFYHDGFIYYTGFCSNDFAVMADSSDMSACRKHDYSVSDAHHVSRSGVTLRFATSNAADTRQTGHWERLADMPLASCQCGAIVAYGRIFLFGGALTTPTALRVGVTSHKFVQAFNLQTLSWEVLSSLPEAIRNPYVWIDKSGIVSLLRAQEWHRKEKAFPYSTLLKGSFEQNQRPPFNVDNEMAELKMANRRENTERLVKCIEKLEGRIRCHKFWSDEFEGVRTSWNRMHEEFQSPNLVCFPTTTNQVSALVKCGERGGHAVCARNGKHSFSGDTCSYGIVVDVTEFNAIEPVDDDGETVWKLGSGNTLGQVSFELHRHGVMLPVGHCPTVGLSGLTLIGGQGPLSRLYGMTSDFVKAVEYIDATGKVVLATEKNENSDALWLARGGSGRFAFPGIITSWHFHHLPALQARNETDDTWTRITLTWTPTLENAQAVMSGWQEFLLDSDLANDPLIDRLTVEAWIAMWVGKNGRHQKVLKLVAFFYGNDTLHDEAAERLFPRLEELAGHEHSPKSQMKMERFPHLEFTRSIGGVATNEELVSGRDGWDLVEEPPNRFNRWKGYSAVGSDKISDEAIRQIVHGMWEAKPFTKRYTEFKPLRGAISTNLDKTATGFWHRDALFWSLSSHFWLSSDTLENVQAILRNSRTAHEQYEKNMGSSYSGSYAAYMDHSNSVFHDLQRYYGGNAERIAETKHKLDPHNLFRHFIPTRSRKLDMIPVDLNANVLVSQSGTKDSLQSLLSSSDKDQQTVVDVFREQRRAVARNEITMLSHGSVNKLPRILIQIRLWAGPASIAMYLNSQEDINQLQIFFSHNEHELQDTAFHVYFEEVVSALGETRFYPYNILRNLALNQLESDYFFAVDVDLVTPVEHGYEKLKLLVNNPEIKAKLHSKTFLVLPAFEETQKTDSEVDTSLLPRTKDEVARRVQSEQGNLREFWIEVFRQSHAATDYRRWYQSDCSQPLYDIKYALKFEPYVIGHKNGLPQYWPHFRYSHHFNKYSWFLEAHYLGFKFAVLCDHYLIHLKHDVSYRENRNMAKSVNQWRKFKQYLMNTYGAPREELKDRYGFQGDAPFKEPSKKSALSIYNKSTERKNVAKVAAPRRARKLKKDTT